MQHTLIEPEAKVAFIFHNVDTSDIQLTRQFDLRPVKAEIKFDKVYIQCVWVSDGSKGKLFTSDRDLSSCASLRKYWGDADSALTIRFLHDVRGF